MVVMRVGGAREARVLCWVTRLFSGIRVGLSRSLVSGMNHHYQRITIAIAFVCDWIVDPGTQLVWLYWSALS